MNKSKKFKVGDIVVVDKVAEISKGRYKEGDIGIIKSIDHTWAPDIIAYQVITPYKPIREKIIFKNKAEMLTELISRGKLYINEEGNEHVYFSEDEMYTLGYVHEDGRSEPANGILDELEFWVEN